MWLLCLLMLPLTSTPSPGVLEFNWNRPQSIFKQIHAVPHGPTQYINYEGAVRTGKTTAPAAKTCDYSFQDWPGIHMCLSRWKDTDLWAQVVPAWRDMARRYGIELRWHPDEQYDEIVATGSRVYLRSLHTNELDSRYSKLAGLTLAVLWVDQPEEVPKDVIEAYVPARLSQPGYPHELWLTPNPVDETDHWIAEWFPTDPAKRKPNYHYIPTALYDNVAGVGQQYIRDMEERYPPGHALRRRFIEGRRGLSVIGTPVYASVFSRSLHIDPSVTFTPNLPLLEAWDFGHHHPAVLWSQFAHGAWHVLGEVQGHDLFIDDFAPWVLQQRTELFPKVQEVWSCCDPAGAANNSHGLRTSALDVLHQFKVYPRFIDGANSPTQRDAAIQKLSGALAKLYQGKPAVRIHPRCRMYIDGLEAGYVWDDRSLVNTVSPNTRRPKKDGTYDHLQNCSEYTWLNFGPAYLSAPETVKLERQMERRMNEARRDYDPADKYRQSQAGGRGGSYGYRGR